MRELVLATRGSRLALAQSKLVADEIQRAHPEIAIRILTIETTGDIDRVSPVTALTEMGAFVRSVQLAVLDGRADLAVHSAKDLPVAGPGQLVSTYPKRADPYDCLVGKPADELAPGDLVGTGSPRRAAQLLDLIPGIKPVEVRGNVDTRIGMTNTGDVSSVVLATAGLERLGLADRITHRFHSTMVPAPGQGCLAVESLTGSETAELLVALDHCPTRVAVEAERQLLALTGAGCRSALGAHVQRVGSDWKMDIFVSDGTGNRQITVESEDPGQLVRDAIQESGL